MSDLPSPLRVRFAPSPTGYLHVGGARTALFNWLLARKLGGQFLLRIEDTDKARSTDDSTRAIFEGLRWLGLDWDEEVVYQGANLARHQADAQRLLETGHAYRDFTTPEQLEAWRAEADAAKVPFKVDRAKVILSKDAEAAKLAEGAPFAIRFKVPDGTTEWMDLVHGRIAFPNKDIEDFVILRSDGTPLYNHAVVSDDIAMGVTLVMRGDDHISNTPKQILIYEALGATLPRFGHLPMIHGTDGKKLSKRHGATAVADWQHEGILPSAMNNFLALLGWSPGGDLEVMLRDELIERFDTSGLLKKAAVFDPKKLEWMNGQHLSRLPISEIEPPVTRGIIAAGLATAESLAAQQAWYHGLLDLLRVRARTVDDIVRQAAPYLQETIDIPDELWAGLTKDSDATRTALTAAHAALSAMDDATWRDGPAMEAALRQAAEGIGLAAGKLFTPLRTVLTGSKVSPGITDVIAVLGKARVLSRVERALSRMA
ncbi:MAG: glutamate--tRNA ligase [Gemmatimonadaceae bacterium]|nr:glutamate--tRNA ligase [Gemmatimonadaceae bacterium]